MTWLRQRTAAAVALLALGASFMVPASAARAELVLSQLIVQLQSGKKIREDVEVWNNSPERAYVTVEASEVVNPGQPAESRRTDPDPARLGLLVSPARMILEPGQRKLVRMAVVSPRADRERVYRVTVKPTVGEVASEASGLKILIGYDVLVLVRPADLRPNVVASRSGDALIFRNDGNMSVELLEGRQCKAVGVNCTELPAKRLYSGAQWSVKLRSDLPADYTIDSGGKRIQKRY